MASLLALLFTTVGCFKDLDTQPIDPDLLTAEVTFKDPNAYKQVLAKLYAGFAVSGQQGPSGQADISGIDEGFGQYLRGYWYHQELSTDEAVIGWNDQTIKDFHSQLWGAGDGFIYAFYSRVFYQISLANEFLRETTDAKLDGRGVDAARKAEIKTFRAEARFLRAISYWHALDLFRNVPFATEENLVGSDAPRQTNAAELFAFLEKELTEIEADLAAPRANEYGRADRAGAWTLLAKLYLNAEIYIGQKKVDQCLAQCEKVLAAGFTLEPNYKHLFLADNHNSNEIIFPVNFDGIHTRTWGGMTFIIRAGIGGSMNPNESGVVSGWGGTRTTGQLIEKFPADLTGILSEFNPGKTTTYPRLYIPNSTQGFNAEEVANSLASPLSNKIYEGYKYFSTANTELKFTNIPSNTGPPQLGDNGADGTLETGGANIVLADPGLYYFNVNLTTKKYVIEKRSWSIIGSATGGQDIELAWDAASNSLKATAQLAVGSFKFRANHDDALNLGDPLADGILVQDGAEIQISLADNHQIALEIDKPDYTFELRRLGFDRRGSFYTTGQNVDIQDLTLFTDGYAVNKFRNVTSLGVAGSDTDFPDTDFPMFRLGDVYLMAAEAILRGAAGGDKTRAVNYVNAIRERAYGGGQSGNFTAATLSLETILDERARELYWECHRRTDLVRFGQFTDGTYKWAWKGGVKEGATVPSFRNIYPIPSPDLGANLNLKQNTGY